MTAGAPMAWSAEKLGPDVSIHLSTASTLCQIGVAVQDNVTADALGTLLFVVDNKLGELREILEKGDCYAERTDAEGDSTKDEREPAEVASEDPEDDCGYVQSTHKLHWIVHPDAPKCADDLSFTSRDEHGRIDWWVVSPADSDYWEVHRQYGRSLAFELLDLIHNPERETDEGGNPPNWFAYIASAVVRRDPMIRQKYNTDGISAGFFEAIGQHLITGRYNR